MSRFSIAYNNESLVEDEYIIDDAKTFDDDNGLYLFVDYLYGIDSVEIFGQIITIPLSINTKSKLELSINRKVEMTLNI